MGDAVATTMQTPAILTNKMVAITKATHSRMIIITNNNITITVLLVSRDTPTAVIAEEGTNLRRIPRRSATSP